MNFVRYDPITGYLTSTGYMDPQYVQAEIDAGKPTLFAKNVYDLETWKVDLETKTIVPNTPATNTPAPDELLAQPVDVLTPSPSAPPPSPS